MHFSLFFVGVLFCNAIPHLAAGLCGLPFPTPFAKPRGKGDSSPFVNALWGFANFATGLYLLSRHPFEFKMNPNMFITLSGGLLLAVYLSRHFGKVQASKRSSI